MVFPSIGQVPASILPLLLAVATLALAVQGNQEPIRLGNCAKKNATVKLYPRYTSSNPRSLWDSLPETRPFEPVDLAPGVCLSGDYPISRNVEIVNAPVCSDGTTAAYSFFSNRRCSDQPAYGRYMYGQSNVQWPTAQYYWSMIFRCGTSPYLPVSGEDQQIDAEPPAGPTMGVIEQGSLHTCRGSVDSAGITTENKRTLAVDTCHTTRDYALRISEIATCGNGTRARMARFSDDRCHNPMASESIVDINDSDLRKCNPLGDWVVSHINGNPNSWKIGSIAFYCDGVQEPENDGPKPKAGAISADVCQMYPTTSYSPPTFAYPQPDTCVNQYGARLKIYENAICPNRTQAVLSQYRQSGCLGTPDCTTEIGDEILDQCIATDTFQSFSFMCTGVIARPAQPIRWQRPRVNRERERRANALFISGIVMLSVGIVFMVGIAMTAVFKDEKRRAKCRNMFRRREGIIVLQ